MKRICSLFLAMVMCFSMLPVAHAANLSDVPENAAYADAVQWAVDQELMPCFADGTFRPRSTITRAEMVSILWREAGQPVPTIKANPFQDVTPLMDCYSAVLWAYETGVTAGRTATTFDPNASCSHAEVLTFLWHTEGSPAALESSNLASANAETYYTHALAWADVGGVVEVSADHFVANIPASRADIANYLYLMSMQQVTEEVPLAGVGQLVISQHPKSQEPSGGMVSFTVQASGGQAPYTYKWESKTGSGTWYRVYDTSSNTLTKFPAASMITSGLYFRCVVADAAGNQVTSDMAKVLQPGEVFNGDSSGNSSTGGSSVPSSGPLAIRTQPQSIVAKAGNSVTFKVEVSGGQAPYTYKWESRNNATQWARVYDSTSNTLTKYPTLDMMKSGLRFRCVITDTAGSTVTSSEATVSSTDQDIVEIMGTYDPNRPMYIYQELQDQSCRAGDPLKLDFDTGGGKSPHSFIWEYRTDSSSWKKFDGGSLCSNTEYTPTQRELNAGLQIRARAYDQSNKQMSSRIAYIRELDTPSDGTLKIVSQPQNVYAGNYSAGDIISYSVEVSGGTAPYQYQWQLTDADLKLENNCGYISMEETPGGWATGYTSPQLKVPFSADMQESNMMFCCVITDAKGNAVVTKPVGFTDAYTGPRVVEQPVGCAYNPKYYDDPVDETSIEHYTVVVEGGVAPYTYQWEYRPQSKTGEDPKNIAPVVFSSADSSWASGFNTDTLSALTFAPIEYSYEDTRYYMTPSYRCKITAADGQFIYTDWCSTVIYDHKG